jgi:hypothetical protein
LSAGAAAVKQGYMPASGKRGRSPSEPRPSSPSFRRRRSATDP